MSLLRGWRLLWGLMLVSGCTFNPPPPPVPLATPSAASGGATAVAITPTQPSMTVTPLPQPSATPSEGAFVELDEAILSEHLNAELAERWQIETTMGRATVRNMQVRLGDGQIFVTGDAQTGWFSLPLSVTTTAEVGAGGPVVRVRQASVAGVLLPEEARRQMEVTLQAALDRALAGDQFEVRSIEVASGTLTARGHRTGSATGESGG